MVRRRSYHLEAKGKKCVWWRSGWVFLAGKEKKWERGFCKTARRWISVPGTGTYALLQRRSTNASSSVWARTCAHEACASRISAFPRSRTSSTAIEVSNRCLLIWRLENTCFCTSLSGELYRQVAPFGECFQPAYFHATRTARNSGRVCAAYERADPS